jgi:hypothetical protein
MQSSQPAAEAQTASGLDRRRSLKVATASGFAMGRFPWQRGANHLASDRPRPQTQTDQPSAFV